MDFGKLFSSSWDTFISQIVNVIVFTVVAALLSLTIVLIPSVAVGYTKGFLALVRDGKKPELSELWSNFDKYLDTLLLLIVGGLLVSIGFCLLVIPGIILMTWWMYAIFLLVDKDLGFWEAMETSRKIVVQTGFINNLAVLLISCILNSIGGSAAGLGVLLTGPFSMILLTYAYIENSAALKQEEPTVH